MNEFIEAMGKGLYLDLPEEILEEEVAELSAEELDSEEEYWNTYWENQAFDEDVLRTEIKSWEQKRFNRKFVNNSRFKNKLRDKRNLFSKGLNENDFAEKLKNVNIVTIQNCKPFYVSYLKKEFDSQMNRQEFFFGKLVNQSRNFVKGQRIGYIENPNGNSKWRKAYAQQDKAKSAESAKAEALAGLLTYEADFYDFEEI